MKRSKVSIFSVKHISLSEKYHQLKLENTTMNFQYIQNM
ncbi:Hypothetical protein Ccan_10680 [Capnocytophaga canimorsus Cc5]|uniref:Uncharacterized protein n=1 Tax=Capnocytophaga canimorsus (strain 5) TaxID=860228 RepID=F9YVM0_CAPCC|nr:Hypothetical protein Ccan_10680 [Capnocytophaga canimorsus Cc5]